MPPSPNIVLHGEHNFDTVDHKTAEAEFFLAAMVKAGGDLFAFQCHLSAYLAASRTTTLALQQFKDIPGFGSWYLPHRQRLQADPVAKYLLDLRNNHIHGGPYPIGRGTYYKGKAEHFFDARLGVPELEVQDIVSICRQHFVTLLEIIHDCYTVLGPMVDPQQYFTKEHFTSLGKGILEAECEVWGWERTSLVQEGYDDDARWHELRAHVSECRINHLFYGYLGKSTPQPVEPEEYADFAFTPDDRGWNHVPAGFESLEDYWKDHPNRRPTDT